MAQILCAAAAGPLLGDENAWRPSFFTAQQNETLVSLGECIIPGSRQAACNRIIDLILGLKSEETKQQAVNALTRFEAEAQARHHSSFASLNHEQQAELIGKAAAGDPALSPEFAVIKEWMADAYWSSEQGLRELGWNGRLAWPTFQPCPDHQNS